MTAKQAKALSIIRDFGPISPKIFAAKMWADSQGHHNHTKCGHGSTRGGGMSLAAGGYLGRLRKAGLVKRARSEMGQVQSYILSTDGHKALRHASGNR